MCVHRADAIRVFFVLNQVAYKHLQNSFHQCNCIIAHICEKTIINSLFQIQAILELHFFRFPDARVRGKHSAWLSTHHRAEARTHYPQKKKVFVGRGLAPAVFALNTCTVGEHSICSRKGKGGYGIRPYDIVEIYLLFAGSPFASKCATALRYEIAFSAKVAEPIARAFYLTLIREYCIQSSISLSKLIISPVTASISYSYSTPLT